jgi:hypothetical protein
MIKITSARAKRLAAAATVAAVAAGALAAGTVSASAVTPPAKVTMRVAGGVAIQTAIAASQQNWADNGVTGIGGVDSQGRRQAQAVVLSRSNEFYDALAGSDLAVDKSAPLLITPTAGLDSGVLAEIKRILPTTGTIYLLGGVQALSPKVQSQLTAAGYTVQVRLAGGDEYATAVAVDQEITGNDPGKTFAAFVATGRSYYDALSAGGAAGAWSFAGQKTVVVLTDNGTMPAESAAYLNSLTPDTADPSTPGFTPNGTLVIATGGPGNTALNNALDGPQLPSWPASFEEATLVGGTAPDTAIDVAQLVYGNNPQVVAIATDKGWYDALTGGAMIGTQGGPLLLTSPTSLYVGDFNYIQTAATPSQGDSPTLLGVEILGGVRALPESIITAPHTGIDAALGGNVTNEARRPTTPAVKPHLGSTTFGFRAVVK